MALRAYGAGILSSVGELQHAVAVDEPHRLPLGCCCAPCARCYKIDTCQAQLLRDRQLRAAVRADRAGLHRARRARGRARYPRRRAAAGQETGKATKARLSPARQAGRASTGQARWWLHGAGSTTIRAKGLPACPHPRDNTIGRRAARDSSETVPRSLSHMFDEAFGRCADRPFSVCMERWMSYEELDALEGFGCFWLQS